MKINRSRLTLYLLVGIPIALMIIPTVIVLLVSLLPTAVAFFTARRKGWYGAICVGAMNLAGAAPVLAELWFTGHTIDAAFEGITDVLSLLVIYGSAGAGWIIYSTAPSIVSVYTVMTSDRRIIALKTKQQELLAKWGPDVESVYEPEAK